MTIIFMWLFGFLVQICFVLCNVRGSIKGNLPSLFALVLCSCFALTCLIILTVAIIKECIYI